MSEDEQYDRWEREQDAIEEREIRRHEARMTLLYGGFVLAAFVIANLGWAVTTYLELVSRP